MGGFVTIDAMKPGHLLSTCCVLLCRLALARDYHVDANAGNDANSGESAALAWKSLDPVNAKTFEPGDRILLKAGTAYIGELAPGGSGTAEHPIELCMEGTGVPPRIDGRGKSLDALLLHNADDWSVHDLEITNRGEATAPFRTGVHLLCDGGHIMRGVRLGNLYVHDVNGDLRKEQEGCGIYFDTRGGACHFDGLTIEHCHVARTDRNGICQRNGARVRSEHIVISDNLLEDIGGDGIKLWGTNGGRIDRNIIHGGRMRCEDYAAGIWPFDSDDTVIEHNEVSGMKGVRDGQGYDSDYQCKNNIFQFNYSHDNDGGFMLLCSPGSSHCDGTIVRYNISQNDGRSDSSVFHISGNVTHSLIYNNLIYVGPKQDVPLLKFDHWEGYPRHTSFFNNVFYADGKATYEWSKSTDNIFDCNVWFGNHIAPPKDDHAITTKPPLVKPGAGTDGLQSLSCYRWAENAKAPRGMLIQHNGQRDFFGDAVPSDSAPDVGVAQTPSVTP